MRKVYTRILSEDGRSLITVWLYGIESGLTEVSAQWADLQGIVCSEGEQIPIDVSAEGDRPTGRYL